ncbi:antibiotic biosynthesis monooxygenase [Mangrovimicrobium sediminis]|uniref:Antibiotic biosynthesis monooxygenase n=1 Tax=Mangrovimicrobium sediminis TaxID=2562682 RepID=A0A4Z0M9U0_9GAMM|nr:antibiotic biosynthesis monooxygenase [Haliea sp. SAOS-164]TGD76158.1 antibiotic biosynthesis monooxygenase [Haliea sp. SAOS-164]
MLVVIFRARIAALDAEYEHTAAQLRETALRDFGCLRFEALSAGDEEIALSWWPDEASISAWKQHLDHRAAQARGRERWYASYSVQVARVEREYDYP